MKRSGSTKQFVVCVRNEGFNASLERRKIYRAIPDAQAARHHLIRVLDESGEDYLYPVNYFVPIKLPRTLARTLTVAA
jgi:hypothetical protein